MSQRSPYEQGTAMGPEQLAALLDSVRELIAILSAQGNILFANAGFTRLLGYRTEDLIGKPIGSILYGTDIAGVRKCLQEIGKSSGEALSKRCQLQSVDGNWRWFEAVARDCSSVPGIEGTVVSFQDVTDLHRMEAERQVISEVVHALNQTANLDELLAGIHQANTKAPAPPSSFSTAATA